MSTTAVERTRIAVGGAEPRLVQAGPAGESEAVVFVHGNPGSADDWAALASAAGAAGTRAVALDLPDFGETDAPPGFEHTAPGYAEFLGHGLEALGITRVHLVLHDFGGPIGLIWGLTHIDSLASVTLINTGILPGYRWHTMARLWRTPVVGEIVQAVTTPGALRRGLTRNEPRGLPDDFVRGMADHYDRRTKRAVLKLYRSTDDPGAAGEEMLAFISQQDIPALVIWGAKDAYLPVEYAERQRDAFPSAEVHVLPDSGHFPYADSPEEVERLLVGFLGRVAGAQPAGA